MSANAIYQEAREIYEDAYLNYARGVNQHEEARLALFMAQENLHFARSKAA